METPAEKACLVDRIRIAAFHLNVLLRGASIGGDKVTVDLVDKVDRKTGLEYTQVVLTGLPNDADPYRSEPR